mgnify:CR=1 FL=1
MTSVLNLNSKYILRHQCTIFNNELLTHYYVEHNKKKNYLPYTSDLTIYLSLDLPDIYISTSYSNIELYKIYYKN